MVLVSGLFKALQMIFGNWHFWSKYHKMTDVCHHSLAEIIMNTNIWGFIFTALCKGMLLWHSSWSWTCLFVVHLHNHWMKSLAATLSIFRSLILVLKSPSHVNNYIFALIWMFMLSVLIMDYHQYMIIGSDFINHLTIHPQFAHLLATCHIIITLSG